MSISKNIKKLLVAGAAIIMAASAGANLNNVNAKRRGRYHYRTHRVYKKHAKRGYKRTRKHAYRRKRARRHVYRRRGRTAGKHTGLAACTYYLKRNDTGELKNMSSVLDMSIPQMFKKYSTNGRYIKAFNVDGTFEPLTKNLLRQYGITNNQSLQYMINNDSLEHGPLHYLALSDSEPGYYSNNAIKSNARMHGLSVKGFMHKYQKHASKWWHLDGTPTKLALQTAERDAINDLNQERESLGRQPVIQDPTLEFIAHKRLQLEGNGTETNTYGWHSGKDGIAYNDKIAAKYNIPDYMESNGENIAPASTIDYGKPSTIANNENTIWGPEHRANRDSAAYNYAGIGIGSDGGYVEEFRR